MTNNTLLDQLDLSNGFDSLSTEATSKTDYKFGDIIFSSSVMQADSCSDYTSGNNLSITEGSYGHITEGSDNEDSQCTMVEFTTVEFDD